MANVSLITIVNTAKVGIFQPQSQAMHCKASHLLPLARQLPSKTETVPSVTLQLIKMVRLGQLERIAMTITQTVMEMD